MAGPAPATIDAYLETLPERSRQALEQIRERISTAAPDSAEGIKYGMPMAMLKGRNILYYAAWKAHVGLYPIYRGPPDFEAALAPYRDKKDTVRFALDRPLPCEIIDLILNTRLAMMRGEAAAGEG
ncbi:MAG: DUF1801 domain-containing protein [Sphingomonas bacterium]